MEWFAVLVGADNDLQWLSGVVMGSRYRIDGLGATCVLYSNNFLDDMCAEEVKDEAAKLVRQFNGVLRVYRSPSTPLQAGAVGRMSAEGVRHYSPNGFTDTLFSSSCAAAPILSASGVAVKPPTIANVTIDLASVDVGIAEALEYWAMLPSGNETLDWVSLFKIRDVMVKDQAVSNAERQNCGRVAAPESDDDMHTWKRFDASSHPHRHGSWKSKDASLNLMSLSEAGAYLTFVFKNYVELKISKINVGE